MVAAATMAHSLFPPQPGPTALVDAYGADMGMVYILGVIVFIPSVLCAGLLLPRLLRNIDHPVPGLLKNQKSNGIIEMPGFVLSLFVPLIPAIIITAATIFNLFINKGTSLL